MNLKKDFDSWPPPSMSKTVPREEAKSLIISMAKVASKPLLVGVAAIRLGYFWNIFKTEELFEELLCEGKLRKLTAQEKELHGLEEGFLSVFGVKP